MSRVGSNIAQSSNNLERRMIPDVEEEKQKDGGTVDLFGDGVHKIYMHKGQLDIYNFGARSTKVRAARGFGKTSYIGVHMMKVVLGLRRQMGGFVGASAKQLYTRTMPNALKVINQLGFEKMYFLGQPPAKLHWEVPLARPRVWENCVSFANGFVWQMLSMAVRGSANGLNLSALVGDETKYLPWQRVKEEVLPTLRGDFMPPEARKVEQKRWGYGTGPENPYYCSQLWVSDAGLTQAQCLWEKEKDFETKDINSQIAEMLAELEYLKRKDVRLAVELSQNNNFLKKLNDLRRQAEVFWIWSAVPNLAMLGGESFLRQMKRELPESLYEIQILGHPAKAARDGWYSNWDSSIHTYTADEMSAGRDAFSLIADKYTVRQRGESLDSQRWPTKWERDAIDLEQTSIAGEDCSCDVDLSYTDPLYISVDCNANLNCMVVGQTRIVNGKPALLILNSFYVMNERKLISLVKEEFTRYYKPYLRRSSEKRVVFMFTPTIKQGGSVAYAVEGAEDYRFDRVVMRELKALGWNAEAVECKVAFHEEKHAVINSVLAGTTSPSLYVNSEQNDLLICAIERTGCRPGSYKKDKSGEKLKSEDGIGGDPRTRTDITDALDDLIMGVKFYDNYKKKIGGGLRGRFQHLVKIPK